jgi:TIR domain
LLWVISRRALVRVFISHSSKDKPAVETLAAELRARDIDPWLDKWEIATGGDIVASINAGLEEAGTGIIVFSEHSQESRWVDAEVSYWTYARIEEGKVLIPVVLGENYFIPPLLRPLLRRKIEEIDAIADAVLRRSAKPALVRPPEQGRAEQVRATLRRTGDAGITAELLIGAQLHAKTDLAALPENLVAASAVFVRGFRYGLHRDRGVAERQAQEAQMAFRAIPPVRTRAHRRDLRNLTAASM